MFTFLAGLFGGVVGFFQELVKTLVIDTIVGIILIPWQLV